MSSSKDDYNDTSVGTTNSRDMKKLQGELGELPEDVRAIAGLRSRVIAWTALDPAHENDLCKYSCCNTFGPFIFLPCFWPHLLLIWPCLWASQAELNRDIRNQYWILTETELKVVSRNHDMSCIPGCCQSGDIVKTIPLENITDCTVAAPGQCMGATPLPAIQVDTASANGKSHNHEATGVALAEYNQFLQAILNQRDVVKGIGTASTTTTGAVAIATAVTSAVEMDRGDGEVVVSHPTASAAERIQEITKLRDGGILTQAEFEKKRQEIIDSI